MKMFNVLYFICLSIIFGFAGCKKAIQIGTPQNQLTTDKIFADSNAVLAALLNTYALFDKTIEVNYSKYIGLYADEYDFTNINQQQVEFKQSAVAKDNELNLSIWSTNYFIIYQCNDIIGQLKNNNNLSEATVNAFICEAKFIRAYSYFYLLNLYGDVPLILDNNVKNSVSAKRTDSTDVYKQIRIDLEDAKEGLTENYRGAGKVRANRWAAVSMLARMYLYQRDWADAEASATGVISSGMYDIQNAPSNVFLANSNETILQFWTQYGYIADAASLIPSAGGIPSYPLTAQLLHAFETGDLRKAAWTNFIYQNGDSFYYPYKYHNNSVNTDKPEYLMALRLGEQYLIRAEARAMQANFAGAQADLNVIRLRAGLSASDALDLQSLLTAILHERQIELFGEWGHRFLDLKRTGNLDVVLGHYKNTWRPMAELLPVPLNEITYDQNLTQNPGY